MVKIYTEWLEEGIYPRKRKYHSAFSSRANSLKSQTFSRLCLGNIPGEETHMSSPFSSYLPFLISLLEMGEKGEKESMQILFESG